MKDGEDCKPTQEHHQACNPNPSQPGSPHNFYSEQLLLISQQRCKNVAPSWLLPRAANQSQQGVQARAILQKPLRIAGLQGSFQRLSTPFLDFLSLSFPASLPVLRAGEEENKGPQPWRSSLPLHCIDRRQHSYKQKTRGQCDTIHLRGKNFCKALKTRADRCSFGKRPSTCKCRIKCYLST